MAHRSGEQSLQSLASRARVSLTVVATFDLFDGGRVTLRSWTHHISRCPDTSLLYRVSDGSLRYRGMISCRKRRPYLMVGHKAQGARLGEQSDEDDVILCVCKIQMLFIL